MTIGGPFSSTNFMAQAQATVVRAFVLGTGGVLTECIYSCSTSLVVGNGTMWASNKTGYTYFRIDTANTPGYIEAA